MQTIRRTSLVLVLILTLPSQALALGYSISARTPTEELSVGDSVVVDIFADVDLTDIFLMSVAVIAGDVLSFDTAASNALPVIHPAPPASGGTTGAAPGYILYSPAGNGLPEKYLEPARSPWIEWPGVKEPGTIQLNIDYWLNDFLSLPSDGTQVTGTNVWIGSLELDVEEDFSATEIRLGLTSSNVLSLFDPDGTLREVDFEDIQIGDPVVLLSNPITLSGIVPEPASGLLVALGIGVALAPRRARP